MTVISSAHGTRIDCDRCGEHVVTTQHSTAALRLATGYALLHGRDHCPRCLQDATGARGDAAGMEPPDSGPAVA